MNKIQKARAVFKKKFKKDDGLYEAYISNVAMKIYDSKLNNSKHDMPASIAECNEVAKDILKLLFNYDPLDIDRANQGWRVYFRKDD